MKQLDIFREQNPDVGLWFGQCADGNFHKLGHCGDYEAADELSQEHSADIRWLYNEHEARKLANFIMDEICLSQGITRDD